MLSHDSSPGGRAKKTGLSTVCVSEGHFLLREQYLEITKMRENKLADPFVVLAAT